MTNTNWWATAKSIASNVHVKVSVKVYKDEASPTQVKTNAASTPPMKKDPWTTDEIVFVWVVIFALAAFGTIGGLQYRKRLK